MIKCSGGYKSQSVLFGDIVEFYCCCHIILVSIVLMIIVVYCFVEGNPCRQAVYLLQVMSQDSSPLTELC